MSRLGGALLALVLATPADSHVWPCVKGQFFRPSLHTCFPLGSPMAHVGARPRHRLDGSAAVTRSLPAAAAIPQVTPPPFALPALTWDDGGAADDDARGRLLLRVVLAEAR